MTSDLALHFGFDEWQGNTVYDGSGTSSHGRLISGYIWTSGILGGAISLDGVSGYISVSTNSIGTAEELTISVWTKPNLQISHVTYIFHTDIIRSQCFGGGLWGISTDTNFNSDGNILQLQIGWLNNADTWWTPVEAFCSANVWNHLALTLNRNNSEAVFYNNGVARTQIITTSGIKPITTGLRIGQDCAGAYNGLIDEVRIYNRTLTSAEILNLYNVTKSYHFDIDGEVLSNNSFYDLSYVKKLNQIEECHTTLQTLTSAQVSHIFENAIVKLRDVTGNLITQGKIKKKRYNDETAEFNIDINDDAASLFDRVYPIRQQLDNVDPTYIIQLLVSGIMPIGTIETSGNFAPISFRIEHDSVLGAIASISKITNSDWWVDHNPTSGGVARLNYTARRGLSGSAESFTLGDDIFKIERQNKMYDTWNAMRVFGYGDGINQKQSYTYHATALQRTTLASNLTSGVGITVVAVNDVSNFNNSGTLRIGIEEMAYTSRNTSGYFAGLNRGTNATPIYLHNKGIECYDIAQYPITQLNSTQVNSSIQKFGLKENAYTDRSIRDQNTLDLLAFRLLNKYKDPSERIKLTVAKQHLSSANIGDMVSLEQI